jgi:glycosyltransferase involved in cell wall biosynthesis
MRLSLGIGDDAFVICTVANLIPYKGHSDLFEAVARIGNDLPRSWRLLVVGRDDGIGADLQHAAARLDIRENVLFLGARSDVLDILSASDIGVLASHEEGFSNAVLEGMVAGLPMVVTDVGGNAEAVLDGETGIVVPPRDIEALARAILVLADDAGLRRKYGESGRHRALSEFDVDRFIKYHEMLYAALLRGKRPRDLAEVAVDV